MVIQALDDDLPPLHLDKSQIEQVVKNIVINGAQAMPHGGYLTVATRYFAASGIVELTFTDTGVGIPADKMEKIWTPFFTTKTKGHRPRPRHHAQDCGNARRAAFRAKHIGGRRYFYAAPAGGPASGGYDASVPHRDDRRAQRPARRPR